jgi:hypothetical protein
MAACGSVAPEENHYLAGLPTAAAVTPRTSPNLNYIRIATAVSHDVDSASKSCWQTHVSLV